MEMGVDDTVCGLKVTAVSNDAVVVTVNLARVMGLPPVLCIGETCTPWPTRVGLLPSLSFSLPLPSLVFCTFSDCSEPSITQSMGCGC